MLEPRTLITKWVRNWLGRHRNRTNFMLHMAGIPATIVAVALAALEIYCYRIRGYVGAYYAALGRVDAVVFTAGVGEHAPVIREQSLSGLDRLGITVDRARNRTPSQDARWISPDDAEVAVLVVPTDEEREIAAQAWAACRV